MCRILPPGNLLAGTQTGKNVSVENYTEVRKFVSEADLLNPNSNKPKSYEITLAY